MESEVEKIMETVCDRCHYPYVMTQWMLAHTCENCPIEAAVRKLAEKAGRG